MSRLALHVLAQTGRAQVVVVNADEARCGEDGRVAVCAVRETRKKRFEFFE